MDMKRITNAGLHSTNKAATSIVAAVLAVAMVPCGAQGPATTVSIGELERIFWACDHAATQGPIDMGTAASCSRATEWLKARKFDGDFDRLLAWWRQHKDERHLALENATAARATAARR